MKISPNCLELIKKWEKFYADAYLDPVGIPTVGYGTTRYPNGKKVQLGDKTTEQEAETFLTLESEKIAVDVLRLVDGISLNQNQFDALVSFCYNVGTGAFENSTLLKNLKKKDFVGAASEFEKWVKGTVNGKKTTLPGLVSRRKDERELFEKQGEQGIPIEVEDSPQDQVTWLEGYRNGDKTIVVAWKGTEVVEILSLESLLIDNFVSVLQQYKNAKEFRIAPGDKTIPSGERISISGKKHPIPDVINPPPFKRLLVRGIEGDDVKALQNRLIELGYYEGKADGVFGKKTDEAIQDFQADYFSLAEADGRVGPRTWEKLWGDKPPAKDDSSSAKDDSSPAKDDSSPTKENSSPTSPISGKNYLRLTKTQSKDTSGCYQLKLEYFKDGQLKDSLEVCSGQSNKQFFRKGSESRALSGEPLPEGKWYLNNLVWAGGKDNYNGAIHQSGIGPVTIPLSYVGPGQTQRSAIEIHIDWNRKTSPGTAGCIGVYSIADYQQLVSWLRDTDPRDLFVDWELGTCPQP